MGWELDDERWKSLCMCVFVGGLNGERKGIAADNDNDGPRPLIACRAGTEPHLDRPSRPFSTFAPRCPIRGVSRPSDSSLARAELGLHEDSRVPVLRKRGQKG